MIYFSDEAKPSIVPQDETTPLPTVMSTGSETANNQSIAAQDTESSPTIDPAIPQEEIKSFLPTEKISNREQILSTVGQEIALLMLAKRGVEITPSVLNEVGLIRVFDTWSGLFNNLRDEQNKSLFPNKLELRLRLATCRAFSGNISGTNGKYYIHLRPSRILSRLLSTRTDEGALIHEIYHSTDAIIRNLHIDVPVASEEDVEDSVFYVKMCQDALVLTLLIELMGFLEKKAYDASTTPYVVASVITLLISFASVAKYYTSQSEQGSHRAVKEYEKSSDFAAALSRLPK